MHRNINIALYTGYIRLLFVILFIPLGFSCKKYLDKKPNSNLIVASTLTDLQALLDNQTLNASPAYLEMVSDNYYVLNNTWNGAGSEDDRLNYIWDASAKLAQDGAFNWTNSYKVIYECNFLLDQLPGINKSETGDITFNSVKGAGLFHRAFQFYQLAQLFCKPYSASAEKDSGIVLKLSSIVSESYSRSTVKQTYEQIITDLKTAADLLPPTSTFATRPNKVAAYGALARVYLSMRDYENAGRYADAALALQSRLLDYNSLIPVGNPVMPDTYLNNPEVVFLSYGGTTFLNYPRAIVDSTLYASYSSNDWRKTVFFEAGGFKGSYYVPSNRSAIFCGIATDEMYLVRAECRARAGNKTGALDDLNTLLRNRWKTGTFTDLTAIDAADALTKILEERRKELLFRGLRWTDVRRLNLENPTITFKRIINGTTYTLPPNDPRWVLAIPEVEISRSGISQNKRF